MTFSNKQLLEVPGSPVPVVKPGAGLLGSTFHGPSDRSEAKKNFGSPWMVRLICRLLWGMFSRQPEVAKQSCFFLLMNQLVLRIHLQLNSQGSSTANSVESITASRVFELVEVLTQDEILQMFDTTTWPNWPCFFILVYILAGPQNRLVSILKHLVLGLQVILKPMLAMCQWS